jgi:hypothetical protein
VLKECGIDSHHKQFRPFLQQLFKVCSKQWLEQSHSDVKTSTSVAMRALVMKHKNTVLKLKSKSPLNSAKDKEKDSAFKLKSIADVKKVLFTDNTPKSNVELQKLGLDLKINDSSIKNPVCVDVGIGNFAVFVDIPKLQNNKNTDNSNKPVSSALEYCSNSNFDNDSKAILAG